MMQGDLILPRGYDRKRCVRCTPMGLGLGLGMSLVHRASGPGLKPPISANLLQDMNASIFASIALNAGNVAAWADQSPSPNNWSQAIGGSQPAYNAVDANMNGRPSVAVAHTKSISGALNILQPNTVYVVGWGALNAGADIFDGTFARQAIGVNTPGFYYYAGSSVQFGPARDAAMHAFAVVFNNTSSVGYVDSSGTAYPGTAGTNSCQNPSVAGVFPNTSGGVGRVLMYNATHNSTQVGQTLAYLGAVYGKAWS